MRLQLTIGLACLFLAGPLLAESTIISTHSFSGYIGTVMPLSDIDLTDQAGGKADAGKVGTAGGLQYLYHFDERLALGGDFNYSSTGEAHSSTLFPGQNTKVSYQSAVMLAIGRINLITQQKVSPYILMGVGFHSTNLTVDSQPIEINLINGSGSGAAFALGLGTDFYFSNKYFLGVEARYQYLNSAHYGASSYAMANSGITSVDTPLSQFHVFGRLGCKFNLERPKL